MKARLRIFFVRGENGERGETGKSAIRIPQYAIQMRVLHFSTIKSWGGGEQQLVWLVEGLAARKVESLVVCRAGSRLETVCFEKGISTKSLPSVSPFFLKNSLAFAKICLEFQPDLIHLHDAKAHSTAVLATFFFKKIGPLVLSRKVNFELKNGWFTRWKYNHPAIKRIICVSSSIKKTIENQIENSEKKLVVVHDGHDLKKIRPAKTGRLRHQFGISENTFLIGTAAALNVAKDPFTFLETAEKLLAARPDFQFIHFGEGPLRLAVEKWISSKNLSQKIILAGFRTDLPELLPDLDSFLFTSKSEGLGSVLLETFGAKVPVVATATGGIPELVLAEKTGLLAPVGRADLLAEQVLKLAAQPEFARKLAENAFLFRENFSLEKLADRTFDIYKAVISEKNDPI